MSSLREGREPGSRRSRRAPSPPPTARDELDIPRWGHAKVTSFDLEPEERQRARRHTDRKHRERSAPARDGYLLGLAIAPGVTSIVALFVAVAPGMNGTSDIPIGIVSVLILQVAALAMVNQSAFQPWAPSWISVGFLTSVMLPMLALQMSLVHEPFVSLSLGSARPALLATVVVVGLYLSFAIWVCWISQRRPEQASLLLMPPTLAIPAIMGERGTLDQHAAIMILSEVTLLAALAAAVVWLFPGWPQLLAGAGALGVEIVRLWASGRGPWRDESSGAIVSVIYVSMLVIAILVVVLIPVIASILNLPANRVPRRGRGRR